MSDINLDNWKAIQTKTFTKWVNSRLKKANFPVVDNIFTGVGNGIAIINILTAFGIEIKNYNKKPLARIQKIENISIILDYLKKRNVHLVNIGPADIVDGNEKLVLGFIYTLILKLSISEGLSNEIFSLKDEVLHWTKKVTACYKNLNIENLTTSWQNGIAFNAIIHRFRPDLVADFYSLNPTNSQENCEKAFKIAEDYLEIPKLFDSEDIVDVLKPDEKSILTYLSQFYQKFRQEEIIVSLKSDLNNFIENYDQTVFLENLYEKKAEAFLKNKQIFDQNINKIISSFNELSKQIKDLEIENLNLLTDSVEISGYLEKINYLRGILNFKKYHPPENLNVNFIDVSLQKPSFRPIYSIKDILDEFENKEALILESYKDVSKKVFKEDYLENQNNIIQNELKSLSGFCFSSKIKDDAFEKMKGLLFDKIEKIKNLVDKKEKENQAKTLALKMAKEKDFKNLGYISVLEFKKILRFLQLETNDYYQTLNNNSKISFDEIASYIETLFNPKINKSNLNFLFEKLSIDGKYKIQSDKVFKGINEKIVDGFVSSDVFENELIE